LRSGRWRWPFCGAASPGSESGIEVLERLFEANETRIELTHGDREPVLSEVPGRHIARACDQLHRAHRWLVVAIGEHVEVRVGDALLIKATDGVGKPAITQPTDVHQHA
jgi:hypothetical protein